MIDIHSHILFDIDDGAKNIEESVELCRDAYENGVKIISATPHFFDFPRIKEFIYERNLKISELRRALKERNIPIAVAAGAELFLSDGVFSAGNLDGLTLNGTSYILCEFPLGPFDVDRAPLWIDELILRGYRPIVAHPERYVEFHNNLYIIDRLIEKNVVFQVNLDSLSGKYGEEPQRLGIDMVMRKIALLAASDAHDTHYRHTRLKEKFLELPRILDGETMVNCMHTVPAKILKDEEI